MDVPPLSRRASVRLPDEAVSILRRLIAERPEDLLFPGEKGQRHTASNVSCPMPRLCEQVGVKAFGYGYSYPLVLGECAQDAS